jgi:UDP-3-O-[3-hydroxymyristoyl] glucosamine N-acyltransferase
MIKYKLTTNSVIVNENIKLYQIESLINFSNIRRGELGGYVQSEMNLAHSGNCWVTENGKIYNNARVEENALVADEAEVYGDAIVNGNAEIYWSAKIYDNAKVGENALV